MKSRLLQTLLIAAVLSPGLGVATDLDAPITNKNKMSTTSTCGGVGNWCDTAHPCCKGLTCEGYGCCLGNECDSGGGPLLKK